MPPPLFDSIYSTRVALGKFSWNLFAFHISFHFRRRVFVGIFISNVIFLSANISCSVIYSIRPNAPYQQTVTYIRVSINYSIFLIAALLLCYCIIKVSLFNLCIILGHRGYCRILLIVIVFHENYCHPFIGPKGNSMQHQVFNVPTNSLDKLVLLNCSYE